MDNEEISKEELIAFVKNLNLQETEKHDIIMMINEKGVAEAAVKLLPFIERELDLLATEDEKEEAYYQDKEKQLDIAETRMNEKIDKKFDNYYEKESGKIEAEIDELEQKEKEMDEFFDKITSLYRKKIQLTSGQLIKDAEKKKIAEIRDKIS